MAVVYYLSEKRVVFVDKQKSIFSYNDALFFYLFILKVLEIPPML